MAHDVFISYAAPDKAVADAVCAALESRHIRCWIAPRDVLPGSRYAEAIIAALHEAKVFVLVFSAAANGSVQVEREVDRAVSGGIAMLPVRVEDVIPSESMEYYLAGQHWLDALTPPLEGHLSRLAAAISVLLGGSDDALAALFQGTIDGTGATGRSADSDVPSTPAALESQDRPDDVRPAPDEQASLGDSVPSSNGGHAKRIWIMVGVAVAVVAALSIAGILNSQHGSTGNAGSPTAPAAVASTTPAVSPHASPRAASQPAIVPDLITFSPQRHRQMTDYMKERYRDASLRLDPRAIVVLNVDGSSPADIHRRFATETTGKRPGVIVHFVIDKHGNIYQELSTATKGRHTAGLNHVAIGVGFMQSEMQNGASTVVQNELNGEPSYTTVARPADPRWADRQVMHRKQQYRAGLALVAWLQERYQIPDGDVVGHAMARRSHLYMDYVGVENAQTDWPASDMRTFMADLKKTMSQ